MIKERVKIKRGFKVVIETNLEDVFHSSCSLKPLQYYVNEWTIPNKGDGPLCLFKTFRQANAFRKLEGAKYLEIFSCEYQEYIPIERKVWVRINGTKYDFDYLPENTVFALKIKLIEKLT